MSAEIEVVGRTPFSGWHRLRRSSQGLFLVACWGVWGTPDWLARARVFFAVTDDFGNLVRTWWSE